MKITSKTFELIYGSGNFTIYDFVIPLRKRGTVYNRCAIANKPRIGSLYHNVLLIDDDNGFVSCPDNAPGLVVGNIRLK